MRPVRPHDHVPAEQGRVHHLALRVVSQHRAGQRANPRVVVNQLRLDLQQMVDGDRALALEAVVPFPKRASIVDDLFGRGIDTRTAQGQRPIDLVLRGDDVLDLRARLGFLEDERIHKKGGARQRGAVSLELAQRGMWVPNRTEDRAPLKRFSELDDVAAASSWWRGTTA